MLITLKNCHQKKKRDIQKNSLLISFLYVLSITEVMCLCVCVQFEISNILVQHILII